jgi:glutamine cyclotransferase
MLFFSKVVLLSTLCGIANLLACTPTPANGEPNAPDHTEQTPVYTYEVVQSWPHDARAYTQGLVYFDGQFLESTGLFGQSTLRRVEPQSGTVQKQIELKEKYFAEGLTVLNDRIYQLTWTNNRGFVYGIKDFDKIGEFKYDGEGWGLTNDGHNLILSDGTDKLRFLDPASGKLLRTVEVMDGKEPVRQLNELEFIKGEVWANVWHQDRIARIDPASGKVRAWVDLSGLLPSAKRDSAENVLNGIAYDAARDRIFVTGKRWSKVFEIRVMMKDDPKVAR